MVDRPSVGRTLATTILATALLGAGACTRDVGPSPNPTLPTCAFAIGDPVVRGGIGASVPKPGQAVVGNGDKVNGFAEITIETSLDRVVTVKWRTNQHPDAVMERCQLG